VCPGWEGERALLRMFGGHGVGEIGQEWIGLGSVCDRLHDPSWVSANRWWSLAAPRVGWRGRSVEGCSHTERHV
jgi:hypothetical protein